MTWYRHRPMHVSQEEFSFQPDARPLGGATAHGPSDAFAFAKEESKNDGENDGDTQPKSEEICWRVLITDDDDEVHRATAFSLRGVKIAGRPLELLHACSADEAENVLRTTRDVAVILLDVVMETPDAGLRLVEVIRNQIGLQTTRIVLRTGQAGYAPEIEVIRRYDINDYRTKSELTQIRLVTTLTAAIRAYAQLEEIAATNRVLDAVARATSTMFRMRTTRDFSHKLLDCLGELLSVSANGFVCVDKVAARDSIEPGMTVVHGAGDFLSVVGAAADRGLPEDLLQAVRRCQAAKSCIYETNRVAMWLGSSSRDAVVVFDTKRPIFPMEFRLIEIFSANLAVGFENVDLIERLDFFAFSDPLTRLPNRTRFLADVDQDLFTNQGGSRCLAIADIVRFSDVNDALGHRSGDTLLVAVSKRLRGALGAGVRVARISGDTFGIYGSENAIDPSTIRHAFEAPFFVHGHPITVQVRVGVVSVRDCKGGAVDLLRDANLALAHARRSGGGAFSMYSTSMGDDVQSRVSMLHALRAAIDFKRGLSVHYQPIVSGRTGRMLGAEALIRWRNDYGDLVPPDRFIPLAERTGMINELGLWVLESALDRLSIWHSLGYTRMGMSINLSPVQLRVDDFARKVERIVDFCDVSPSFITFELTEALGLEDRELVLPQLQAFKALGIRLALDDFGAGGSSIHLLGQLPLDVLKIDRSFVALLDGTSAGEAATRSVWELARCRGLDIVAEGVETSEQAKALLAMGCEQMQGYHFARPMSVDQFDTWMRESASSDTAEEGDNR